MSIFRAIASKSILDFCLQVTAPVAATVSVGAGAFVKKEAVVATSAYVKAVTGLQKGANVLIRQGAH